MAIENLTNFAVLDANIKNIRSKKGSLTFSEIAAMDALIYRWHKAGAPQIMEMADREFESIIGLCRQHAIKIRRSLRDKGIIDFTVSQGSITRYIFGPGPDDAIKPPRRSAQAIENRVALIEAMRRQNRKYEQVDLERHYNEFVVWSGQNRLGEILTPRLFRGWMRKTARQGFPLYPLTPGEKTTNGSHHPASPVDGLTPITPTRGKINNW